MPFVHQIAEQAAAHLIMVDPDEPLFEVAAHLYADNEMVVVCDDTGRLDGVVTKTDLVAYLAKWLSPDGQTPVSAVLRRDVTTCSLSDELHQLLKTMKQQDLRNVPIVDAERHPIGVANARDVLSFLLEETESDEALLQNYVMGFGYR